MGNTGKPSRACASCKKRKIRCDLTSPACNNCLKARWACPGVLSEADVKFRHHGGGTFKAFGSDLSGNPSELSSPGGIRMFRGFSPPLEDRATAFFVSRYVLATDSHGRPDPKRAVCSFLVKLLQREKPAGVLGTIISATGLAALANAGKCAEWKSEAFAVCGRALRQLNIDLGDAVKARSDHTLAAIMLMGTFEKIASANADSMRSFSQHTIAAARCIEIRGPKQFSTSTSIQLFLQMRRIIITTCHQLQEPIPYALHRWSSWAQPEQEIDDRPTNRFSEINEVLAAARAEIKHKRISDPRTVAAMLLPIDAMVEDWRRSLPESWSFTSYRDLGSANARAATFNSQYDMYPDLQTATRWNTYRNVRILIHEAIMSATLRHGTLEETENLGKSAKVLRDMANAICHSVPYHLGYTRSRAHTKDAMHAEAIPSPGGFLILWPLFFSGMLRTACQEQRVWIATILRHIGMGMGIQLALSMAEALEQNTRSFSDRDVWFIGEFYPY